MFDVKARGKQGQAGRVRMRGEAETVLCILSMQFIGQGDCWARDNLLTFYSSCGITVMKWRRGDTYIKVHMAASQTDSTKVRNCKTGQKRLHFLNWV